MRGVNILFCNSLLQVERTYPLRAVLMDTVLTAAMLRRRRAQLHVSRKNCVSSAGTEHLAIIIMPLPVRDVKVRHSELIKTAAFISPGARDSWSLPNTDDLVPDISSWKTSNLI
jgi:hypothetical protein